MSQDLIEKIKIGHEGFSRGDLTEAKENISDDVEWSTTGDWPGLEGTYRGKEAVDACLETLPSEWEIFGFSLVEVTRDDGDVMVVAARLSGCGRESGVEVEMQVFSVYWAEEGKIVRRKGFSTLDEALAAL